MVVLSSVLVDSTTITLEIGGIPHGSDPTQDHQNRPGGEQVHRDVIHAVRKNPGITQAEICRLLGTDKGAVARQTANLEEKGYLYRQENPADRRSQQIFPTEKAQLLKNSKAQIETICYEWLAEALTPEEQQEFARLLERIYLRSKAESKAGFPNLTQKVQEAE